MRLASAKSEERETGRSDPGAGVLCENLARENPACENPVSPIAQSVAMVMVKIQVCLVQTCLVQASCQFSSRQAVVAFKSPLDATTPFSRYAKCYAKCYTTRPSNWQRCETQGC